MQPARPLLKPPFPRAGRGSPAGAALVVTALVWTWPLPVAAQGRDRPAAEGLLPVDHWSRDVLRRLAGAGLLEPVDALAAWPLSRARTRALARRAADLGEGAAGFLPELLDRDLGPPPPGRGPFARARLAGGWDRAYGRLLAGASVPVDGGYAYPGPRPAADHAGAVALSELDAGWGSALAGGATLEVARGRVRLREAHLALERGGVMIWAGRRTLALGSGALGGVVVSGGPMLDGLGASLAPAGPPDWARFLGRVGGDVWVARAHRSGEILRPWFFAARLSASPAAGLALGFNRAALFGGDGNEAVNLRRLGLMLLGFTDVAGKDSDFENQVASADVYWRISPGGLPLAVYGEWGFDDMGHAWFNVPGVILGAELPVLPGLAAAALGLEHARFSRSCCGNPPWYRHGALAEGWSDRGVFLGHPLGGHGREWAVRGRVDTPERWILAGAAVFARSRGQENLLAPAREGRSVGGSLSLVALPHPRIRLSLRMEGEEGRDRDWRQGNLQGALRVSF